MPGIVPLLVGLSLSVLSHGQSKCDGCGYAPRHVHPRINTSRQSTCGGGRGREEEAERGANGVGKGGHSGEKKGMEGMGPGRGR